MDQLAAAQARCLFMPAAGIGVKRLWLEPEVKATRARRTMLEAELASLAAFVGVSTVG